MRVIRQTHLLINLFFVSFFSTRLFILFLSPRHPLRRLTRRQRLRCPTRLRWITMTLISRL